MKIKTQVHQSIVGRIELVRRREHLSQRELAKKIGWTQPRLSALINGKLDLFSLEALIGAAEVLGMSVTVKVARPYKT